MTSKQVHQKLNEELGEYIRLNTDAEKDEFWHRITQESNQRTGAEKATVRKTVAEDVDAIRQRVLALKKKVENMQERV